MRILWQVSVYHRQYFLIFMRSEALDGFLCLFTTEMQFFRYPMLSPCLTVLRLVQSSSSKVKNHEYDVFRAKYIGVMVDLKHAEISPPS